MELPGEVANSLATAVRRTESAAHLEQNDRLQSERKIAPMPCIGLGNRRPYADRTALWRPSFSGYAALTVCAFRPTRSGRTGYRRTEKLP